MARYRATYFSILAMEYGLRENAGDMVEIGSTALRLMRDQLA